MRPWHPAAALFVHAMIPKRAVVLVSPFALLTLALAATPAPACGQPSGRDVFAFVHAMDQAAARDLWPGFRPSEIPVALFDGEQTILLRHPAPPPEFTRLDGRPGVLAMRGRHPAVVSNSTRDINGVRTGTVIATAGQVLESTMLAYVEEVFHVFWLGRHANFRPNEMARYAYPLKDARNLQRLVAEDEALARGLESDDLVQAAAWAAAAFQIRGERVRRLGDEARAFETALEMMEGTANYVARLAVGQRPAATAARLRAARDAEGIRWRFYETGTAICFLLDRLEPGWKARIDADVDSTIAGLLEAAVARRGAAPAAFSASELGGFERRAAADIAALSGRQAKVREETLSRPGPRIVVEVTGEAEPLRVSRFDPINLLVLDDGETVHPNYLTLTGPAGTIDITNGSFARGSFAGTVALTRSAGRHPLASGVRTLTVTGLKSVARIERRDGGLSVESEGVRLSLRGAVAQVEGNTVRVVLHPAKQAGESASAARAAR